MKTRSGIKKQSQQRSLIVFGWVLTCFRLLWVTSDRVVSRIKTLFSLDHNALCLGNEDSVAREFLNLSTERYGLVKTTFWFCLKLFRLWPTVVRKTQELNLTRWASAAVTVFYSASGFHRILRDGVISGVGRKCRSSDYCDSESYEPTTYPAVLLWFHS